MIQQFYAFLVYFFSNPSILGIGLAIIFGAIWLAIYRPPLFKDQWLWAVLAGGAVLAPIAIFLAESIAAPAVGLLLRNTLSAETVQDWSLLAVVPGLCVKGLVREGAMLVPVVVYWWRSGRIMGSRRGLTIGAVAGAGVGLLEAQWTLNFILGSGWTWGDVQTYGVVKLAGFWETFFILGFNVASCALAGWGLGRGWGWQFYLLASFAYAILLYTPALAEVHLVEGIQLEFVIAALALLLTGVVLWLREMRKE